jgi:hypothetical protein
MNVVHQNEAQLAGVMTPKSILKKTKFAAKDTLTEGETREGEGDQINLVRMSLAAPTDATTTITTGTQPGEGTLDQQGTKTKALPFRSGSPPAIIRCMDLGRRAAPAGTNGEPKSTDK